MEKLMLIPTSMLWLVSTTGAALWWLALSPFMHREIDFR